MYKAISGGYHSVYNARLGAHLVVMKKQRQKIQNKIGDRMHILHLNFLYWHQKRKVEGGNNIFFCSAPFWGG